MCDTLVALPNATADGSTILAKNSDREPNEAQALSFYPRGQHAAGTRLRCTYIEIPQAQQTHTILLSRPFWMWGGEMGANEHGVVIGNEAVFAKVKTPGTGLTGMDLLRLGLERAATADEALEVITSLLEAHGQGGSGGYQHPLYYHNSFIIADRGTAWVLETVDRHWAARRVREIASISNGLTIGSEFDLASKDLIAYAVKRGWCKSHTDFHFTRNYSDFLYTRFSQCRVRQPKTEAGLRQRRGSIRVADMMALLRSHRATGEAGTDGHPYDPARGSNGDICMHFGGGLIRGSQTTGSLVAHLAAEGTATYWLTGASAPCLGIFKPFYLDGEAAAWPVPLAEALGPEPGAACDSAALWWQGERLHRAVLIDYPVRAAAFAADRARLEADFLAQAGRVGRLTAAAAAFSTDCIQRSRSAMAEWLAQLEALPVARPDSWAYRRRWQALSAVCGMPAPH